MDEKKNYHPWIHELEAYLRQGKLTRREFVRYASLLGMSAVAALLAGLDLFVMGGLLDGLMVFDFAKAVIDSEISLMLKQTARGLRFSEENLALDVIAEVGPGGLFLDKLHTLQRMRSTALLPEIADRAPRDEWEASGSPDSQTHAMHRVREILTRDNPAVFSPDVDAHIRAEFEGLVAGEAMAWGEGHPAG